MQSVSFDVHQLDIPEAIFPDEATVLPAHKSSVSALIPFTHEIGNKPVHRAGSFALKIVRARTGETEMRLLAKKDAAGDVHFVLVTSTIAPYKNSQEVLVKRGKKRTPMNKDQAVAEFDRRVGIEYPPETLRNGKVVPIHISLL